MKSCMSLPSGAPSVTHILCVLGSVSDLEVGTEQDHSLFKFRIEPVLNECHYPHPSWFILYISEVCRNFKMCIFWTHFNNQKHILNIGIPVHSITSPFNIILLNVLVGIIFFKLINLYLVAPHTTIGSFITQCSFKALFKMQFLKAFIGMYQKYKYSQITIL